MKINIQNIINKISEKDNSTSLLIVQKNVEVQQEIVSEIAKGILKLEKGKSYKACPDVFGIWPEQVDGRSIKIEQIHEFIRITQFKPYSLKFKVGVIISVEKATQEAQNALLKTLEEPPKNTFIILTTSNSSRLLPTIVSRCQVIELEDKEKKKTDKQIVKTILKAGVVKRFELIEEITKRKNKVQVFEEVIELLENLLAYFKVRLLKSYKDEQKAKNIFNIIKLIELTKLAIDNNVNLRLALENLMINLPIKGKDY